MKISGRVPRWAILLAMIVFGVLISWYWHQYGIARGLGEALAIAGFLGFTIERWFRQDFAEDVFHAGLGAVLRPEFKDELRWLTSFEWLATKTEIKVQVHEVGNKVVKLTLTISKELENISADPQPIYGGIGIDEWEIPGHKSRIEHLELIAPDGTPKLGSLIEETPTHLEWRTEEITVDPGQKVRSYSKSIEYRRMNDIHVLASMKPARIR